MIQIFSTPNEYHISLPYSERSRAKSISGFTWDSDTKLWRYPKTKKTFDAISAEFGPDECEWKFGVGAGASGDSREAEISRLEAQIADRNKHRAVLAERLDRNQELLAAKEELVDSNTFILDLWNSAEQFGLPEDCERGELATFTKAAYEGNYHHADLAAKLATAEAKLQVAHQEILKLKNDKGHGGEEHARNLIIQEAWASSSMPQVVRDFSFDGRSAIELQNFLAKTMSRRLNKENERMAFSDLIREAEDAGLLSNSTARVCHTLRIQRNCFAHESIAEADIVPRSALCLFSFVLVYRELLQGGDGTDSPM